MGRLRLIKPRVGNTRNRVSQVDMEGSGWSAGLIERREMYASAEWRALRRRKLNKRCWTNCGKFGQTLDHLLGHDFDQATAVAQKLRIPCEPDWRIRFWQGPFITLCNPCHSSKTQMETRGRLMQWIEEVSEKRQTVGWADLEERD